MRFFTRYLIFSIAILVLVAAPKSVDADLIFAAVVDGTNTGGNPKAFKLEATSAIADLSAFFILRDTNGTTDGPFTVSSDFQLPAISLAAGEFFIVYGNADSETLANSAGQSLPGVVDGIANHNGDDILAISTSLDPVDVVDAFGLLGQGDTNFAQDSLAIRNDPTPNATGVQDAGNFSMNTYSDELYFDTFVVTAVPEPATATLFAFVGLGLCGLRRRS